LQNRTMCVAGMLLLALLCNGCVVPGDRYAAGSVSYGVGFYEPYGYDYGGWGSGYLVGPPRGDHRRFEARHVSPSRHAYRPAPPSHHMPSIPNHPRPPRVRSH
jgi:hypothetical protein